jgi:hypothetical protein
MKMPTKTKHHKTSQAGQLRMINLLPNSERSKLPKPRERPHLPKHLLLSIGMGNVIIINIDIITRRLRKPIHSLTLTQESSHGCREIMPGPTINMITPTKTNGRNRQ